MSKKTKKDPLFKIWWCYVGDELWFRFTPWVEFSLRYMPSEGWKLGRYWVFGKVR